MPALVAQVVPPSVDVSALPALSTAAHSDAEGQEMSIGRLEPSTPLMRVQVGETAPGLVDVTTRPIKSTATHSVLGDATQDSPSNWVTGMKGGGSTSLAVHAPAPPVGFVEVTTLPPVSPATHSAADTQDMLRRGLVPSTFVTVHVAAAPSPGSVDVRTFPALSPATHRVGETQETLRMPVVPSALLVAQLPLVVGSVEVRTVPRSSTAT